MSKKSDFRPRLRGNVKKAYEALTKKESRILVIGDLHEPFCLDGYLEHCKEVYAKHNCNQVIFIGDVIDSHASSFHEQDPDGLSAGDELGLSIKAIAKWYKAFPKAEVCIGNHDRIITRKAFASGVSVRWIKKLEEVLETPNWTFGTRFVHDNVQYIHGESGRATKKAKDDMMSTVQGHRHTEMFTEFVVGANYKVFGCAVGCGVNNASYAMAYGKNFKKPAIGCAVIFNGEHAINEPMKL